MTHQKILSMIEAVDPSDTQALDEIDFAVRNFLFRQNHKFVSKSGKLSATHYKHETTKEILPVYVDEYTRSRDALKAIRPEGWRWIFEQTPQCHGAASAEREKDDGKPNIHYNVKAPTEELAELHAIIQSIAHERGEK